MAVLMLAVSLPEEEGTYFRFFVDNAFLSEDPSGFLTLFFMGILRLLPIVAMTPYFGAKVLPHPVKVALSIVLYILLLPHILSTTTIPLSQGLSLFTYGFKELFIGTVIGVIATIPFFVAETAGIYIDHQRGGSSLMVQDPVVMNQDSPLGIIWNYLLIVTFYTLDGEFIFLEGIIRSYSIVPIDAYMSPQFFTENSIFWEEIKKLMGVVMRAGIQIASPALLTILMTEVFLGIANRLAPNVMITFLGMPLKSLFGLGIITFGWGFITGQLKKTMIAWLYQTNELIESFAYGL